ncbi:MAG: flagellar assembly protein FlaJ, partial [Methanosarcinales archaeon]
IMAKSKNFETFPKIIEQIKENTQLDVDLVFMLTYMASISTADLTRDQIFEQSSKQKEWTTSKYIKKIELLAKNWNYEYSRACALLAKKVSNQRLKDLLGRLSSAMSSGESEKDFLRDELETTLTRYTSRYESDIELLKKWTDAYAALLVSSSLIVLIVAISMVLYQIGDVKQTTLLTSILIFIISMIGVYILWRSAPSDIKIHSLSDKSKEQILIQKLSKIILPLIPLTIAIGVLLEVSVGWIFLMVGILLAPIGIIGWMDDKKIDQRDQDFSSFVKTLGSTAGTMGTTLTNAMKKIDKDSIGSLEDLVRRLYSRLSLGLNEHICWLKFAGESGSETINRLRKSLVDAVNLGGDPAQIGKIISNTSLRLTLLRTRREETSSSFTGLMIPLHTAMTGILIFVVGILKMFNEMVMKMYQSELVGKATSGMLAGGMGMFSTLGSGSAEFAQSYAITIVIILTIADALAIKAAAGGANYKICYYGSIMSIISGINILLIPLIVKAIFTIPNI